MSADPILILQMQRMGDLILSFPLLGLLQKRFPQNPLWTVAEPRFFHDLFHFSPNTVFFPPEAEDRLRTTNFHSVINLSHRQDAARIAGSLQSEHHFGAYHRQGHTYIAGYWSLHRAGIVCNNRHNLFHWSNLQQLDHVQSPQLPSIGSSYGQSPVSDRVGIFVGASEAEKRPDPTFFGLLAKALLRKGLRPLFLGGPDDVALGQEAMHISGIADSSLCGKLSVSQLAQIMSGLALCITPDTGPMHLATWVNTPVLNLSLGPVNAWETGPLLPGHHVLRPALSCAGCWHCASGKQRCRAMFHPGRVALVAHTLLHSPERASRLSLPGLELLRSGRDQRGLYYLHKITAHQGPSARECLSHFWQDWFWSRGMAAYAPPAADLTALAQQYPRTAATLRRAIVKLGGEVRQHILHWRRGGPKALPEGFWSKQLPILRPFSGHMHLYLQNEEYAPHAWEYVLQDFEILAHSTKAL